MTTGADPLGAATAARLADTRPTFVGGTDGAVPHGFDRVDETRVLGVGVDVFERVSERLLTWQVHRGAGLGVRASAPTVGVGVVAVLAAGVGRAAIPAPVRVVEVIHEPRRRGFVYATLPGHPERGEESFVVELGDEERVMARIAAVSRPARWYTRIAPPAARVVQSRITRRYFDAFGEIER